MYSYGIDLGTTYSCIARADEKGNVEVIKNIEGKNITPSVVEFISPTEIIVGETAKGDAILSPENVVLYIKRSMGKHDENREFFEQSYTPEQISAFILKKLVTDAEQMVHEEIKNVCITVPAYFGFDERKATENAGVIAGLNVLSIVNEPTAAAIAYGAQNKDKQDKIVLVYDLGGGTFDITVAEIIGDKVTVIATNGNHTLGGKDWDAALMSYFIAQFCEKTGVTEEEIYDDSEIFNEIVIKTEAAKKELTNKNVAGFSLSMGRGKRAKLEVTLEKFNELTRHHLISTIELTKVVLAEAAKKKSSKGKSCDQFDEIIFVGGSTRMRQVKDLMKAEFGAEPQIFEPDEAVARGAALLAQFISENTTGAIGKDGHYEKPDTSARFGEVTSKSYGTDVISNGKNIISNGILKNDVIPVSNSETYYTNVADQRNAGIDVYESNIMEHEIELSFGKKIAEGVLALPAGLPKGSPLEVTYSLDRDGLLTITAVEKSSGQKCVVSVKTEGLSDSMVKTLQMQTSKISVSEESASENENSEPSSPVPQDVPGNDGGSPWNF
jgi:molecular chaperone DnaK (HSP70)